MEKEIKFNLSPSSLNGYIGSQLTFFYTQIIKIESVDWVPVCYGLGGNLVHHVMEEYAKDNNINLLEMFNSKWIDYDLDNKPGVRNSKLKKPDYINAVLNGKKAIDDKYEILEVEEKLVIPSEYPNINYKGLVDVQARLKKDLIVKVEDKTGKKSFVTLKAGSFVVMDYKTSSSIDEGQSFKIQGLFYSWLIYKIKNIVPVATIFEYIKIKETKAYAFDLEEILEFEIYLKNILKEIVVKGFDIDKYEAGDWDTLFNGYKSLIQKELQKRNSTEFIDLELKDNKIFYNKLQLKSVILDLLDKRWSYLCEGHAFSPKFQAHQWDGKKHFLKDKYFPAAFYSDFEKVLDDYNKKFNTNIKIKLADKRDERVVNKVYDAQFNNEQLKSNKQFISEAIKLRYYQEEAKQKVLERKPFNHCIIQGACAMGKTILGADLIKTLNQRSLFIVNRIELADQTKESFEKYFGVDIGLMTEGKLDIDKQITVASIQTIVAILKRKDETKKHLLKYLYNLNVVIADECHNVKDSGMYGVVSKALKNVSYVVGLSGTPKRRGSDTLELNSLCGFVCYKKLKNELIEEGWIAQDKIYFIKNTDCNWATDYPSAYTENIVDGEHRNNCVIELVDSLKNNLKILVLTRRVQHAKDLSKKIEGSFCITGGSKDRKENFKTFRNDKGVVLVGSVQIFSTGVDIPDLDMIIYCVGSKDSNEVIQSIGRIHRKYEGKEIGYYIDFEDEGNEFLENAVVARKQILDEYEYTYETTDFENIKKIFINK